MIRKMATQKMLTFSHQIFSSSGNAGFELDQPIEEPEFRPMRKGA